MGILDRFRRNRQESVLPEEVQEYYQSENRQRRGVAVLLAVAALIFTIAIAAGLFFGGRFLYNQIWGDDQQAETTQDEDHGFGATEQEGNQDDGQGQADGDTNATTGQEGSDSQDGSGVQGGTSGNPGTGGSSSPEQSQPGRGSQGPTSGGTTPSSGDGPLPHTGDPGM